MANKILGGVNDGNRAEITDDLNAVITDLQALISAKPEMFEGSTGEHADAVVRQLQLELTYINDPNISPDAARASIDNILDIIEIVQSDPKLAEHGDARRRQRLLAASGRRKSGTGASRK